MRTVHHAAFGGTAAARAPQPDSNDDFPHQQARPVELKARTSKRPFRMESEGMHLFQVNAGVDAMDALSCSEIYTAYVTRRLEDACVTDDTHAEIHVDDLHVMLAILEMAKALREAAGAHA